MTPAALGPRGGRAATAALAVLVCVAPAAAEEWHEAYRSGVRALARGDAERAVASLERAIAARPEPGRNVVTYGTNIEPRYYPYLRLAEAQLALGQLQLARTALETSAKWGREPSEERRQLEAKLSAALEARRPPAAPTPTSSAAGAPPTTAPPTAAPTIAVSAPATSPIPPATPEPPTPSPAAFATPLPSVATPPPPTDDARRPSRARALEARPAEAPSVEPRPPELRAGEPSAQAAGTLEILSQPPGALAYLDDEPLGSTDPVTGRLVKTGVPAGPHRVRVAITGYLEATRQIDVAAGGSATFYATLTPRPAETGLTGGAWLAFGVVAVALAAAVAWMALRRPPGPSPIWSATPRPSSGSGLVPGATPPGHVSPGARRDELGQEWFGEYRLLELLGRGGMASVFKAARGNELFALKRPLGSYLDDAEFLERFLREAEIGRTLNHPNIVRILGRGNVDGVPYFIMELLAGQTLQAQIQSWGAAEPRTAASVVAQVAEALDYAHSKGVIHRDLKPSNVMLLLDGTAKVMDFGIARSRRLEGLTTTGAFLGTPDYVAPEVIEGERAEPRSDLYSLGAVFFEVLTGQRLFSGDNAFAILKKHCSEPPPPPSRLCTGVPAELDALVLRLLAKTPEGRLASAEELVVALREWLNRAAPA